MIEKNYKEKFCARCFLKIIAIVGLFVLKVDIALSANVDASSYQEVELIKLKATPEEYKNKKICYASKYKGYRITFLPYIEKSGFKPNKAYMLHISPMTLPVMAKKTEEMNQLIPTLRKGKKVKVYGKVERFRIEPAFTAFPRYYLDLDKIEILEDTVPVDELKDDNVDFDQPVPDEGGDNTKIPPQLPFQKKKFNK